MGLGGEAGVSEGVVTVVGVAVGDPIGVDKVGRGVTTVGWAVAVGTGVNVGPTPIKTWGGISGG